MREVLDKADAGDDRARLAIDMYCYRVKKYIGAYLAALGSVDALVFTAGIGENSAPIRARITARLGSLGLVPVGEDAVREDAVLSAPGTAPAVLRIEAREDLVVARAAARVIESTG